MFCHCCEGMHGTARRDLFFFSLFLPGCYGIPWGDGEEWEHFFLCPPLPAFDGRPGTSGAVQQRTNAPEGDFTQSHQSCSSTHQYQQEPFAKESVGLMILNGTDSAKELRLFDRGKKNKKEDEEEQFLFSSSQLWMWITVCKWHTRHSSGCREQAGSGGAPQAAEGVYLSCCLISHPCPLLLGSEPQTLTRRLLEDAAKMMQQRPLQVASSSPDPADFSLSPLCISSLH